MKTKHLLSLLLFALCATVFALPDQEAPIYLFYPNGPKVTALTEAPKANPVEKVTVTAPKEGADVRLLHTIQKKYVNMPHDERIAYFADAKKREEMKSQGYHPKTVELKWTSDAENVTSYNVVISEKKDFVPAISVAVTEPKLELNNLKIAMTYYWKVTAVTANGSFDSPVATFSTEKFAPRLLKINGVPNVRDLGGRVGLDGRRVRQGIVYRTAGLNNNAHRLFLSKLEAIGEHPEIAGDEALLKDRIEKAKAELAHVQPVEYVRYSISPEWTTFCPEGKIKTAQAAEFLKLTDIPDTFLGANKTVRTVDANGELSVENPSDGKLALFMQVFESPRDGYMQIGCAADWNWCMAVNNVKVIDYMRQGNGHSKARVRNNTIDIPVKQGMNVIAVVAFSDAKKCGLACGKPRKALSRAEILKQQIAFDSDNLKNLYKYEKGFKPGENRLDDEMKEYMTKTLGIKSDIDLRSSTECFGMKGSPMGDAATWFHISSSAYGGMGSTSGKAAFKEVFKVFLDEKNYPIDFHCIAGQDRTGAVAFIINALLGVPLEDLYLDWEVTGFWNRDVNFNHEKRFNHLVKVFDALPGANMTEKVENYVLGLGFTKDDIAKLRAIMLE